MPQPDSLLSPDALAQALAARDLTDPSQGPHAVQRVLDAAVRTLAAAWRCEVATHRASPIVPSAAAERPDDPAAPGTPGAPRLPPVSSAHALRTRMTAAISPALHLLAAAPPPDVLLVCPGVVFAPGAGEGPRPRPASQADVWRIRRGEPFGVRDLAGMIGLVVRAVAPGFTLSAVRAEDDHVVEGRQLDVRIRGEWVEIGRCGLVRPGLLDEAGLPADASALSMTLDLDRLVLLAKGLDDVGLLRSDDPGVARQMIDLAPYVPEPGARSARSGARGAASPQAGSLDEVRASIDDLDGRIVKLLAERRSWALRAARLKKADPRVPAREEQVVANVRARAREAGIEADLVEGLYRHLMDEFVRLQRAARREAGAGERAPAAAGAA